MPLYMAEAPDVRNQLVPILPLWSPEPSTLCALFFGPARLTPKVWRRLARELHDTTAQWLAALSMNLSVLTESTELLNPRARAAMAQSTALADRSLREIRTISYLLPPELDELGLESALSRYIDGFIQRSGIQVEVKASSGLGPLAANGGDGDLSHRAGMSNERSPPLRQQHWARRAFAGIGNRVAPWRHHRQGNHPAFHPLPDAY
jgi:hypothetical protein